MSTDDKEHRAIKQGRGKWGLADVPHKGWAVVDSEDLEEPSAICEMCEAQTIRYTHTMRHRDYPHELKCGCVCASAMSEDYEGTSERERQLRALARRRANFLKIDWVRQPGGRETASPRGFDVAVWIEAMRYRASIMDRRIGRERAYVSPRIYASALEAKQAIFEALERLRHDG